MGTLPLPGSSMGSDDLSSSLGSHRPPTGFSNTWRSPLLPRSLPPGVHTTGSPWVPICALVSARGPRRAPASYSGARPQLPAGPERGPEPGTASSPGPTCGAGPWAPPSQHRGAWGADLAAESRQRKEEFEEERLRTLRAPTSSSGTSGPGTLVVLHTGHRQPERCQLVRHTKLQSCRGGLKAQRARPGGGRRERRRWAHGCETPRADSACIALSCPSLSSAVQQ